MNYKKGNSDEHVAGDAGIFQKPNREEGFVEQRYKKWRGEKVDLIGVDKNGETPGVQISDNKEKGTKRQGGTRENKLEEGNNQPQVNNMDISGDIEDNYQASNKGGGRVERNFEEDESTKETYEVNN
ncbi:hypothetical protein H5410_062271 [Solanum commersonii]|uniref:Uncharacterized protein n=1 Tax=Solanum commersonii TaxID=4109 RepID=A0A9J5WA72_SOLCO|nr:hypothetical protein H5410_062271 [Solanum commersonii]